MKTKTNRLISYITIVLVLFIFSSFGTKKDGAARNDSPIDPDKKLEWFHQAKFGLFIHWGLYAVPAGEWNGQTNYGEWIQYSASIPGKEYAKFAKKFNPVKYDAKEWVSLAKQAGMKYIVITTKHHEGFCMFDSKLTKFDIVDASPYGKDPMKELAKECKKQEIRMCFYYSVKDWHNPDYPVQYTYFSKEQPEGFHGFPNPKADYQKYFDYMQGQVKEILTNYGPVGIVWFDWCGSAFDTNEIQNRKRAEQFVDSIHKWQPGCLINNRLGGIGADYGTPEQEIPGGTQNTAFEVCMTLNDHWGYNKNDNNFKSPKDVIYNLCDIASKGGNYLLNVGPTAEGIIPEPSQVVLKEVGKWLSVNGDAIYGTTSGGPSVRWNADIKMITAKPGTYYLHLFQWPEGNKVYLNDFTKKVEKVYLLADKKMKSLKTDIHPTGVMIHLPDKAIDPINSVVVVKFAE